MKYHVLFFVMLLFSQISFSQERKFSVEANLFRVIEDDILEPAGWYRNQAFFLNGINVGYQLSEKFRPYVAVNYQSSELDESYGFSAERISKKEVETRIGVEYTFNPQNKLQAIVGAQFFYDTKNLKGTYFRDYGSDNDIPIDHEATDISWSITAGFRYQVNQKFYVFSKSRLGRGNYHIEGREKLGLLIYDDYSEKSSHEEPISALGLAFKF